MGKMSPISLNPSVNCRNRNQKAKKAQEMYMTNHIFLYRMNVITCKISKDMCDIKCEIDVFACKIYIIYIYLEKKSHVPIKCVFVFGHFINQK